jgi:transposase-like protein
MAYSEDLRSRVLACVESGENKTVVARRFGVSRSIVFLWCQTPQQTAARQTGPKGCWKLDLSQLKSQIEARPDSYQRELAKALGVTRQAVRHGLRKLKITRKKNDALPGKKRRMSQYISAADSND